MQPKSDHSKPLTEPVTSSEFPVHSGDLFADTTSEQSLGALGLSDDEIAAVSAYTAFEAQPQDRAADQPHASVPPTEEQNTSSSSRPPSEEELDSAEPAKEWFEAAREAAKKGIFDALGKETDTQAAAIRKQVPREPGNNGYWELAGVYGPNERKWRDAAKEAQREVSSKKPPSTYNELDEYALGLMAKGDGPLYLAQRLADHVGGTHPDGRTFESFVDNTTELQTITKLLILEGLREQSAQPYRYDEHLTLLPALQLLTEATRSVPGFDPEQAGLGELEHHTIFQRALLKLESPHWTHNRIRDQQVGDPARRTTGACANAIAEVGTVLALRKLNIPEPQ